MTRVGVRTVAVAARAAAIEHEPADDGIRSASVRELRLDAGLAGERALGARLRRRSEQHGAAGAPASSRSTLLCRSRPARSTQRLPCDVRRRACIAVSSGRSLRAWRTGTRMPRTAASCRAASIASRRRPCVLDGRALVRQRFRERHRRHAPAKCSSAGLSPGVERLDHPRPPRPQAGCAQRLLGDFESARVDQQPQRELAVRPCARSSACSSAPLRAQHLRRRALQRPLGRSTASTCGAS